MPIVTADMLTSVPGMTHTPAVPPGFLQMLCLDADACIKNWCKQNLEARSYQEYPLTVVQRDLVLKQHPVYCGTTTVSADGDGLALPQSTIPVSSTRGFCPGNADPLVAELPTATLQIGSNDTMATSYTTFKYTGVTSTSFTGCTDFSGSGTLTAGYRVSQPVVWFDPNGYYGATPDSFADGTLLQYGYSYVPVIDRDGMSYRGLIRRIGGAGAGFIGFYPENFFSGKLGAYKQPTWPKGDGNVKVCYSAGYTTIPADLKLAAVQLVATLVRVVPSGQPLSSENLGGYSYSVLTQNRDMPEVGSIIRTLARYREISL